MVDGGQVENDPSIPDDSYVLRRIPDDEKNISRTVPVRPSSINFREKLKTEPVSVVLGCELERTNRAEIEALAGLTGFFLVRVQVMNVRALALGVVRDPTPEEPAHGLITGLPELATKEAKRKQQALAKAAEWVVGPAGAALDQTSKIV